MDRRLCLQKLTTVTAVAWLPGAAFADVPQLPPVSSQQTGTLDPLYAQAVAIVMTHKKASISLVQRHLRLGYSCAAGLLESMAQAGLISVQYVHGYRQILEPSSG